VSRILTLSRSHPNSDDFKFDSQSATKIYQTKIQGLGSLKQPPSSPIPQNNRSKHRSTRVDHVSEARFEIESLDLCGFEKSLKTLLLSSLFLSFLVFSFFSTEKGRAPFSFLSSFFF
jgi:hypothetical protein